MFPNLKCFQIVFVKHFVNLFCEAFLSILENVYKKNNNNLERYVDLINTFLSELFLQTCHSVTDNPSTGKTAVTAHLHNHFLFQRIKQTVWHQVIGLSDCTLD